LTFSGVGRTVGDVPAVDERLDLVFHALADRGRRSMLERLSHGSASVSELAGPLPMSLAAVVQHVQVLEAAGVVRTEKVGRVRRCELDVAAFAEVDRWIAGRRAMWSRAFDRLGEVLAEAVPTSTPPPQEERP
jgi:DNA-binding transcriptional ArsR family regulator